MVVRLGGPSPRTPRCCQPAVDICGRVPPRWHRDRHPTSTSMKEFFSSSSFFYALAQPVLGPGHLLELAAPPPLASLAPKMGRMRRAGESWICGQGPGLYRRRRPPDHKAAGRHGGGVNETLSSAQRSSWDMIQDCDGGVELATARLAWIN